MRGGTIPRPNPLAAVVAPRGDDLADRIRPRRADLIDEGEGGPRRRPVRGLRRQLAWPMIGNLMRQSGSRDRSTVFGW